MFSELVVCYLFLGGAGAGACLVLSVMGILVPRSRFSKGPARSIFVSWEYRKLFGFGFAFALVALVAGGLFLFADLGRADMVLQLFTSPRAVHITIGAYALIFCILGATLQALIWAQMIRRSSVFILRLLCVLTALISLVVIAYTGLLLQSLRSVPLWHNIWLPALFILSSLSCGMGLVMGASLLAGLGSVFGSVLRQIAFFDGLVIALEALSVVTFLLTTLVSASKTAVLSGKELVLGSNSGLFWAGFVLLGLVVPLALDYQLCSRQPIRASLGMTSAACVLAGGFVMRYCLVQAGVHPGI
ncbi:NrfD/PsrC family molybdoenzyme membrane anchor subunit [uncultured Ellagibacter sp.]|uniref:NrfD/PsrC family molybdoenzyme membrane anchor subunit n=1 Tax=uncultured Ellagibacter sp. TaxID=2137580 RepID=UPI00345BDF95